LQCFIVYQGVVQLDLKLVILNPPLIDNMNQWGQTRLKTYSLFYFPKILK